MSIISRLKKIGVVPMLYKLKHMWLTPDDYIVSLAAQNGAYQYMKRYDKKVPTITTQFATKPGKYIWTCWLQGMESAPLLVRRCIERILQFTGEYQVVVLTQNTICDYITIPDYIEEKHQKGIIPDAHYTDIVRLLLLHKFGGVWIDSTIWLTDSLPDYVTQSPLFVYQNTPRRANVVAANNFIAAYSEHPILSHTLNILLAYWKTENRLVSYSIFHLAFTMACERYPELFETIPIVPGEIEYQLMYQLNKPYSEQQYQLICRWSPIHKLSYKYQQFHYDPDKKGSFYDHLINKNLC